MNQNSSLNTNIRCGEIYLKENQEFFIICVLCNEEFYNYSIFTDHLLHKICKSNATPLLQLQQTLKIEKDIIGNLLVQPKIEPPDVDGQNYKCSQINTNDVLLNKLNPKTEPKEIDCQDSEIQIFSNSINKNVSAGKCTKLLTKMSPTKPVKRTRIIKKKIIWDPDDPKTQFLCENYQNKSPKNQTKKCKEQNIQPLPTIPPKLIKHLPPNKLKKTNNINNSKQLLVKTFEKQSRIGSTPKIAEEQPKRKKIQRIKKVFWDPDALEDTHIYKSKTNIDNNR